MSKVDWSKAPEGAEFYAYELFRKTVARTILMLMKQMANGKTQVGKRLFSWTLKTTNRAQ